MHLVDALYLAFISLAMCAVYFILLFLFPRFFSQEVTLPRKWRLLSLAYILLFSTLAYVASYSIRDLWLGNRVLHIFGGGFLGFFMCFLAARDSGVRITKFQFFLFSSLIVLALGVGNELLEFLLQTQHLLTSATSIQDTWLDLASNVVGVTLASVVLTPFHKEL